MRYGEESQMGSEPAGVSAYGDEGFAHGAKEKVVDEFGILERHRRKLVR
jgi:hypothetical protein